MRKLIFAALVAAISVPALASAQTREIRNDERKVEEKQQDLQAAIESGDPRAIENEAKDARKAGQELREDRRNYQRTQYVAPYSKWTYTTLRPGDRLRSRFYGDRYAISDPGMYQLAPAARYQRWVRYGDDLVLVNKRTGRVLQVASNRY